jgi:hypothetical protein
MALPAYSTIRVASTIAPAMCRADDAHMTISRRDLIATGAAVATTYGLGMRMALAAEAATAPPAPVGFAQVAADCVRIGEECLQDLPRVARAGRHLAR